MQAKRDKKEKSQFSTNRLPLRRAILLRLHRSLSPVVDMALLDGKHALNVRYSQTFLLPTSQKLRSLEHVLDLASVHLVLGQLVEISTRETMSLAPSGREEVGPDVATGRCRKLLVLH